MGDQSCDPWIGSSLLKVSEWTGLTSHQDIGHRDGTSVSSLIQQQILSTFFGMV